MIRFPCQGCGIPNKAPDGTEGRQMRCPRCGRRQRVSGGESRDVAAALPAVQRETTLAMAAPPGVGLAEGQEAHRAEIDRNGETPVNGHASHAGDRAVRGGDKDGRISQHGNDLEAMRHCAIGHPPPGEPPPRRAGTGKNATARPFEDHEQDTRPTPGLGRVRLAPRDPSMPLPPDGDPAPGESVVLLRVLSWLMRGIALILPSAVIAVIALPWSDLALEGAAPLPVGALILAGAGGLAGGAGAWTLGEIAAAVATLAAARRR